MELVFATYNQHKLHEIKQLFNASFRNLEEIKISCLAEIGCHEEIPENGSTLQDNASEKAWFIYNNYGKNCFADDTGLEILSLDGRPGVYSARYAGEKKSFDDNMNKVLLEMKGKTNRTACFRTVISLIIEGKEFQFEGKVNGIILESKKGKGGFGYDPIFLPDGYTQSFAEMPLEEKNKISHRGKAFIQLMHFLKKSLNG